MTARLPERLYAAIILMIIVVSVLFMRTSVITAEIMGGSRMPGRENPLVIDEANSRVLLYAEVNKSTGKSTHFGVVSKDGRLAGKALFKAFAGQIEFHDALVKIGAKPGNDLRKDNTGTYVRGDRLKVTVTWPGLQREMPLEKILEDSNGREFDIKFGGNRAEAAKEDTGCITCLESCWIGITSNASYPLIGTVKRFLSPNAKFSVKNNELNRNTVEPVILIYTLTRI
jgi:hypothetical protein